MCVIFPSKELTTCVYVYIYIISGTVVYGIPIDKSALRGCLISTDTLGS